MATLTIRRLDDETKARLRQRAADHDRSMEEEARRILRTALAEGDASSPHLVEAIRRRFEPLESVDLEIPPREPIREPPEPEPLETRSLDTGR